MAELREVVIVDGCRTPMGKGKPGGALSGLLDLESSGGELVAEDIANPMLNGETIRLDGAIRMGPR